MHGARRAPRQTAPIDPQPDSKPDSPDDPDERRGERREPVIAALVVAIALPILMPAKFSPGPGWLLPVVLAALLVAMAVTDPGRIDKRSARVRAIRVALVAILATGAAWATIWLTADIIRGGKATNDPGDLLLAGALVLADLMITFAFVYWELDSGGPGQRAHSTPPYPDLAFPQHMSPELAPPGWRPVFLDYLYLGITNSVAFSPTDVMPLAHWAKGAMALQSVGSLAVLGLVIARAVNVLT